MDEMVSVDQATMPAIHTVDAYARAWLSAPTHRLLCHFAAADADRPLPLVEADWEEVFQAVCSNGLLGLTQACLKRQPAGDYPPAAFRAWVRQAYLMNSLRMALRYRQIDLVLRQFAEHGLEMIVLKGPALAHTLYDDPLHRSFGDLDLCVRERDWRRARAALVDLGFTPEEPDDHLPPKLIPQVGPYEHKYWHADLGLIVEVHYDDILNAGLVSRDVDGFWARSRTIDLGDLPITIFAPEDQLIHLCAHAHYHGYTRLNCLSDIAQLLRRYRDHLDWRQVLTTTRREEAQVAVYYSLLFTERLLGVAAPAAVLAAMRPNRLRRWLHEYYLPEAKVLSLEPMPRPDFSFYFLPFLKRLVPDLLVMGRRREKLRYLARLLAPPPIWLRHHYAVPAHAGVGIHRLLHPLKLVSHYLAEIGEAIGGVSRRRRLGATGVPTAWWAQEAGRRW